MLERDGGLSTSPSAELFIYSTASGIFEVCPGGGGGGNKFRKKSQDVDVASFRSVRIRRKAL